MPKPDPVRELARLARFPEPGGRNIGTYLRQHAADLAELLGVPQTDLLVASDTTDDVLAPKVRAALQRMQGVHAAAQQARQSARAVEAAQALQQRARWQDGAVLLEPSLLLGELLAEQGRDHLLFALHGGPDVVVERRDLVATARTIGRRPDLAAFVDRAGVHVRWSGGRGGLSWYPRLVTPAEREQALRVELPGPVPTRSRPRARSWTWDVMADLGFAT